MEIVVATVFIGRLTSHLACQPALARGVRSEPLVCKCRVCISERMFLRILAMILV